MSQQQQQSPKSQPQQVIEKPKYVEVKHVNGNTFRALADPGRRILPSSRF